MVTGSIHDNSWSSKIKRAGTSFLPVAKNRKGKCTNCGACCMLPVPCMFLRFNEDGTSKCAIYPIRPLQCRKYPRTELENITKKECSFYFK